MKIVGIFSKAEQKIGFKLAGIESKVASSREEVIRLIEKVKENEKIGILVIDKDIYNLAVNEFDELESRKMPLLLKIDK